MRELEEERARFQGIMAAPECQCSVVLVRSRGVCNLGGEEEDGSMAMVSGERRERERVAMAFQGRLSPVGTPLKKPKIFYKIVN